MPPKDAASPAIPAVPRPQTPNDLAIMKTESSLSSIAVIESKWTQRQQLKGEQSDKNFIHRTTIEVGLQLANRMLADLERSIGKILQKPEQTEEKGKKPAATKGTPAAVEEPPIAYRASDVNDMTNLFMKFYQFEASSKSKNSNAAQPLAMSLKKEAKKAVEAYRDEDESRRGIRMKTVLALSEEPILEGRADEALSLPKGLDKTIWQQMLQLRSKRLQLVEAADQLEKELVPLTTRSEGLVSMSDVTQYALSATLREKGHLTNLLREQETKRVEEIATWNESNIKTGKGGK